MGSRYAIRLQAAERREGRHSPREARAIVASFLRTFFAVLVCAACPAAVHASRQAPRPATLEDVYDREAGNRVQSAFGFLVWEGTQANPAVQSYGVAFDDMTVEWAEVHPIQQPPGAGCGGGTCDSTPGSPRAGKLCFNNDDCGAGHVCSGATPATASASCAALSWGTNSVFNGSGVVALNLVDFNAETTQGTFNCTLYGFTSGCDGGNCLSSNDCDNDGRKEVEVSVTSSSEANAERVRMEQPASGSAGYSAQVTFSSSLALAGDGIVFLQFNGAQNPSAIASYFDKDSGAADVNGDGTPDSPPSNGKDTCPGFCGVDDNKNATGPDHRPGAALFDDDENGLCDFRSSNGGAPCVRKQDCPLGTCLSTDEPDELCGRTCTAGTTSGLCSAGSSNAGAVCIVGGAPACTGGGHCVAINCNTNTGCGAGGDCPGVCYNGTNDGAVCHQLSDCTSGAVGGFCGRAVAWGDDICSTIDEPAEQCAVIANRLVVGTDDNCGCSQNPVTATLNAFFDTADLVIQSYAFTDNGDADGIADDNELMTASLTLRNIGPVDVDDVRVHISSQSPEIVCINDPAADYGRINTQQAGQNLDPLQFTIGTVNRTALSQSKQATLTVTVMGTLLLADGTQVPVGGTSTPQSLTFDLDLDVGGTAPVATTTKIFSFEPSQYASGAAWASDWFHSFVTDHDGLHCQYNDPSGTLVRCTPVGCFLRQDAGTQVSDDWHLHSAVTGGSQSDGGRDSGGPGICSGGKTPGGACSQSADCFGGCTGAFTGQNCLIDSDCPGVCTNGFPTILCRSNARCRFCNNDHAITCTTGSQCAAVGGSCGSAGTCQGIGTCSNPVPGTCTGLGNACMHMGFHPGGVMEDTIHLDNIFYTYYKGEDQGGGVRTPLQIGLGRPGTDDPPILDWWQQVSLIDDRMFSNVSPPYSTDAGVVQILPDRNNDGTQEIGPRSDPANDGFWEKLEPYYGAPRQQRFPFGNCTYDPDDDGNNEDDLDTDLTPNGRAKGPSSTCFPEFVWACAGDTQDPPYTPDIGQVAPGAICFPQTAANGAPIVRQGSGPGRWVEVKVDLSKYKGRKVWFRFLTTHMQFGCGNWSQCLGCDPGACQPVGGNRDDGWYIDDIRISGTSAPFSLTADTDTPPASSCPNQLCSGLTARFSGSTFLTQHDGTDNDGNGVTDEPDDGAYTQVATDAPLRRIDLNAQDFQPTTGTCINGVLQYRFWADRNGDGTFQDSELIRDFSENPRALGNPLCEEHIRMDVRCSSAPSACGSTADLLVTVAGKIGPMTTVKLPSRNTLSWDPFSQATSYDVAYKRVTASHFDGDFSTFSSPAGGPCPASCQIPATSYDISCKGNPPATQTDLWVVRARGGAWVATWDEGGAQAAGRDAPALRGLPASICP